MKQIAQAFVRSDRGNVAMIFGLAVVPLVIATGAALDYSRAASWQTRLQSATDATVLSLCQEPTTTSAADLRTKALKTVQAYVPEGPVSIQDLTVTDSPRTVTLTSKMTYPTAFMKIAGQDKVDVSVLARCTAQETYFEIALVLDTTGSMANADPAGVTKMAAVKTAATNFVNYMYTTGALPGHVRMSLVPFAASVAVDPAANKNASWLDTQAKSTWHWQNVTGAAAEGFSNRLQVFNKLKTLNPLWDWAGCLESLPYPLNTRDDAPSAANPDSLFLPMFAPDEVGNKTCSTVGSYESYCWDKDNANSYINDGTGTTGSCQTDDTDQKRYTQACKYKNPLPVLTSHVGPNWQCTSRPLSRLGTSQATLLSEIATLTPGGQTNIHEGLMWGWRTISSNGIFKSDPQAYDAVKPANSATRKVIVLMTDGENTWSANNGVIGKSQYSAYGYFKNPNGTTAAGRLPTGSNPSTSTQARAAIDALTQESCENAKKDLTIYTIGFSTPGDPIDAQGLALLKSCATSAAHAFVANDEKSLIDAFKAIGAGIGELRLTN